MYRKITSLILMLILISSCAHISRKGIKQEQKLIRRAQKKIQRCIEENISPDYQGPIPVNSKIDSITANIYTLQLKIYLSKHFSYPPLREQNV